MSGVEVDCRNGFKYIIYTEQEFCRVYGTGRIGFLSSVTAINDVATHPSFQNNFKILVDLSEINFHPSYSELHGIIEKIKLMKPRFKNKLR